MSIKALPDLLKQSARKFPKKTALVFRGTRYTFQELDEQSDQLAYNLTQMGCASREKIGVCCWNSPELVLSFFAIWKLGGIVVDLNPSLRSEEIIRILHHCEVKTLITERTQKNLLEQIQNKPSSVTSILFTDSLFPFSPFPLLPSPGPSLSHVPGIEDISSDIACINYTSGTTGVPKGVLLPHENLIRNAELNIKYFHISSEDRTCLILPLFFGMNKIFLLAHFMVGATVLLEQNFLSPNSVLASMEAEQITGLSAVPAIYQTLLTRGDLQRYPLVSLRYFRIGAGQVPPKMIQKLLQVFSGINIYLTYGLTEVGLVAVLPPERLLEKKGSCGRVIPEVQVTLVEEQETEDWGSALNPRVSSIGEIVIQSKYSAWSYYGNKEETRNVFQNDGIHTGDLGWIDEEGYLYLVGRQKEIIKSGSENIHPGEIEAVLSSHEDIAECAAIGVPDAWLGEVVKAFVVPKKNRHLDTGQILKFCNSHLSPIKRPKYIVFCDSLPKTETGKIKKGELT